MHKYQEQRLKIRTIIREYLQREVRSSTESIISEVQKIVAADWGTIKDEIETMVVEGLLKKEDTGKRGTKIYYSLTVVFNNIESFFEWVTDDMRHFTNLLNDADEILSDMEHLEAGLFLTDLFTAAQLAIVEHRFNSPFDMSTAKRSTLEYLHRDFINKLLELITDVSEEDLLVRSHIQIASRFKRQKIEGELRALLGLVKKNRKRRQGRKKRFELVTHLREKGR